MKYIANSAARGLEKDCCQRIPPNRVFRSRLMRKFTDRSDSATTITGNSTANLSYIDPCCEPCNPDKENGNDLGNNPISCRLVATQRSMFSPRSAGNKRRAVPVHITALPRQHPRERAAAEADVTR